MTKTNRRCLASAKRSNQMNSLTQKRLKELLMYNSETGLFYKNSSPLISIGAISNAAKGKGGGYVRITIDRNCFLAHRLAWLYIYGYWPTNQIDHRNGNRSDNKITNLREATSSQNMMNRDYGSSQFGRGVAHVNGRKNPWKARIYIEQKEIHLGYFSTREEASSAYAKAAEKHHKDFSALSRER